jgi:hypothetical protein
MDVHQHGIFADTPVSNFHHFYHEHEIIKQIRSTSKKNLEVRNYKFLECILYTYTVASVCSKSGQVHTQRFQRVSRAEWINKNQYMLKVKVPHLNAGCRFAKSPQAVHRSDPPETGECVLDKLSLTSERSIYIYTLYIQLYLYNLYNYIMGPCCQCHQLSLH